MHAPQRLARITGLLYLIMAICSGSAEILRTTIHEPHDAAATAHNVVANAGLVRIGVAADLVAVIFGMLTAMAAYVLLKHVNKNAARAVVIFTVAAAAMMGLNMVHQFGALLVATDPTYVNALGAGGSDALVQLLFELHRHGYLTAQIFFGLWLLPLGYLVYKSGMFPRVLGVLLMIGCFCYLVDLFAQFLAPDLAAALAPFVLTPPAVAEISMLLWLLIKGAKAPRHDTAIPATA
ncbi:DUF4386 domain-containing protein [Nonomuraea turcica]|uniref:DUF4386 domain-containing protein n=1 Tax=Nonomuraea sp. G32 TaxID=3067274 RepID=UPI00273B0B0B|nr:DUF4386 domain-containing protein [Nonomuraea sp. G32]MDP4511999.1 DUF4386 domain-containing protein [Nonomuraea sp. G32]